MSSNQTTHKVTGSPSLPADTSYDCWSDNAYCRGFRDDKMSAEEKTDTSLLISNIAGQLLAQFLASTDEGSAVHAHQVEWRSVLQEHTECPEQIERILALTGSDPRLGAILLGSSKLMSDFRTACVSALRDKNKADTEGLTSTSGDSIVKSDANQSEDTLA